MSNSEHNGKHFVIQKGKAICDKGSSFPNFKVTSHQKHYWNNADGTDDYLAVTEDDLQFNPIAVPFGNCSVKNGQPCSFAPSGKWQNPYDKVKVMGKSCLTEISELQCAVGGKIKVMKHGQTAEITKHNFRNADARLQQMINPVIDFREFVDELEEKDFLDSEETQTTTEKTISKVSLFMIDDTPINEEMILKYHQTIKVKVATRNMPKEVLIISLYESNGEEESTKVAEITKSTNENGFLWCEFKLPLDFQKMTNAMMEGNQNKLHEYYVIVKSKNSKDTENKIEEVTVKGKYKRQVGFDPIVNTGRSVSIVQESPILVEETPILAKALVHFRPKNNWVGEEYGFDWMRLGETSSFGDTYYKDIVAEQYTDSKFTNLETDVNEYDGYFKTSSSMFAKLRNEYGVFSVPWKKNKEGKNEDYFCSWLSLYPQKIKDKSGNLVASSYTTTKALLTLIVEINEEPQTLKFKENPHFTISPMEITAKSKGTHKLPDYVTIECVEEFSTDQAIEVYAVSKDKDGKETEKLAGKLMVWANDETKRKKAKVLLVDITTPPISSAKGKKGNVSGQKELFEKYLKQALIEVDIETLSLDLSSDDNLKPGGKYVEESNILAYYDTKVHIPEKYKAGYLPLQYYLNGKLKEELKAKGENEYKYSKYFVAFYLGENGGKRNKHNKYQPLNGYASGNFVVLFPKKSDETASHEFLHTKGVPHSFTNKVADANAEYTYIYGKTENIMDYSHNLGQPRFSLWKWQWKIANSKITDL